MARRGVFVRAEEVAFLREPPAYDGRASTYRPGPLCKAPEEIVDAIDGLAEVVTPDPRATTGRVGSERPGPEPRPRAHFKDEVVLSNE